MSSVTFPWPPRQLSPNSREDRRAVSGIRAKYRADCGWTARAGGLKPMIAGPLHLDLTFHPPDHRPRDLDNMLAGFKSGLDGLCDVIQVDDSWWSLTIRKGDAVPGGSVKVRIGHPVEAVEIPIRGEIR
jgi:crossover junction endodeoxyribonuclease RusA